MSSTTDILGLDDHWPFLLFLCKTEKFVNSCYQRKLVKKRGINRKYKMGCVFYCQLGKVNFGKSPLMFHWRKKKPSMRWIHTKMQIKPICTSQPCIIWSWGWFQEAALILGPHNQMHCLVLEWSQSALKGLCFIPPKAPEKSIQGKKKSDLNFISKFRTKIF